MAYRITYVFLVAVTAAVIAGNSRAQQGADSQGPIDDSQTTANAHHVLLRQKWQSAGRKLARTNSAALRAQAIRQKLQMRTAPALNVAANTGAWVSLGPSRFLPTRAAQDCRTTDLFPAAQPPLPSIPTILAATPCLR